MGYEGYQFESYWNVKVINLSDYFTGGYRILDDGQMELYWDNPLLSNAEITRCYYSLRGYREELDPLQKSTIIDDYACREAFYFVSTTFKTEAFGYSSSETSQYEGRIVINTPIPQVYFEDLDQNKLRVYWDKLAVSSATYKVHYSNTTISDFTDTTIVLPKPQI